MTFAQTLIQKLEDMGLWPKEASAILDAAKLAPASKPMTGRWDDPVENYPPVMLNVVWFTVKSTAKKWLAQHAPLHWARPMFDEALLAQLARGDESAAGWLEQNLRYAIKSDKNKPTVTPSLQLVTPNYQQIPRSSLRSMCPDAPDGEHDFQPDEEYAQKKRVPASECVCCVHCGEPKA
jgi:hypothetical protein